MTRIIKAAEIAEPLPLWRPEEAVGRPPEPASEPAPSPPTPTPDPREIEDAARSRGLADGTRAAEEAYRAKLARIESLAAAVQRERTEFFDRIEPELVRLAVAIAEKVIGRELELRPDVAVDMVRTAMKRLRDREALRVSVNPRDLDQVKAARDDLVSAVDGVRKLEVVEDRRVGPGGCVIESPNGTLDARIKTQIEEIEAALDGVMPDSGEENGSGSNPLSQGNQPD